MFDQLRKKFLAHGMKGVARSLVFRARHATNTIREDNPYRFLRNISGVVHVGANSGQERNLYAEHNLRVLWIEPVPSTFEILKENIRPFPKQSAVAALVTDKDDVEYSFNIANNDGESSSLLNFARHSEIWPEVEYTTSIKLKSSTLDRLVANANDYQALIMDTQGSELLVLKGARNLLNHITYIRTEAADFESYVGCARVDDITNFLIPIGFALVRKDKFAKTPLGGSYFDLLYARHPRRAKLSGMNQVLRGLPPSAQRHIAKARGAIDYFLNPAARAPWGGPFNGQERRQDLFMFLISACQPSAFVETGTYRGTSTKFIAERFGGLPIYSVEGSPRNFGFAKMQTRGHPTIKLFLNDSRAFLSDFAAEHKELAGLIVLFYLDAHWQDDLPLSDEIQIIFSNFENAIVVIDDFQVPGDQGYGYDDYGPGKALTPEYIAAHMSDFGLSAFYPAAPSSIETGAKRGTVVLARSTHAVQQLRQLTTIGVLRNADSGHVSAQSIVEGRDLARS